MVQMKASTIWYVDTSDPAAVLRAGGAPDYGAARALAGQLHPDNDVVPLPAQSLDVAAGPDSSALYVGCWPGVTVVCGAQFAVPRPSELSEALIRPLASERTFLVGMNPDIGWGGFAHWERGVLRRSFSATRVNILEDEGLPMVWERPFWAGEHPMSDRLPDPGRLPFDPLHFADTANWQWLGFCHDHSAAEPDLAADAPAPASIALAGFALYPLGQAPTTHMSRDITSAGNAGRPFLNWLRRRGSRQHLH
ncbi:MAG: hypothetical protein HOQ24_09735 [Mycobacteriaceae bacterium]|nr:hypothetical protein [Mycobacteriaceae bacterium]